MTERHLRWVYGEGDEPDLGSRFANERTFLAWVRTALAMLAGGVALHALGLPETEWVRSTTGQCWSSSAAGHGDGAGPVGPGRARDAPTSRRRTSGWATC